MRPRERRATIITGVIEQLRRGGGLQELQQELIMQLTIIHRSGLPRGAALRRRAWSMHEAGDDIMVVRFAVVDNAQEVLEEGDRAGYGKCALVLEPYLLFRFLQ